jgi:hypothetical protein
MVGASNVQTSGTPTICRESVQHFNICHFRSRSDELLVLMKALQKWHFFCSD